MMYQQSVKASTSFVNTKSKVFCSQVLLLTICYKLKLFVSSSSQFKVPFSGVLPGFTFGKTPSSLLIHSTTLAAELKFPYKIILIFSSSSFCMRYYCNLSNTSTNLFKEKFGTVGLHTVTTIVFS